MGKSSYISSQEGWYIEICVDYSGLNTITKVDTFPRPRINDSLNLLVNTSYFTTLDLMLGYWQIGMDPQSQLKTAFCYHSELYEYILMPFGLCNALAMFQRLMETVLAGLERDKCCAYLDGILVVRRSLDPLIQRYTTLLSPSFKKS